MGFRKERKEAAKEIKKTPTRLIWIPGIKPVIVPADTPMRMASISCNNMEFDGFGNF